MARITTALMFFFGLLGADNLLADTESASWGMIKAQSSEEFAPAGKLVVTKNKAGGTAEWAIDTYVFYDDSVNPYAPVATSVNREKGEYSITVRLPRPHRPGMELVMYGFAGWDNGFGQQWSIAVVAHLFAKVQGDGRTVTFIGKWTEPVNDDLAALVGFGAHSDPLRRASIEITAVHRN